MTSVSSDRRFGVNSGMAVKVPCKAATTANITLSGEQTIDGVSCVTGDRVLVQNQTDGTANGIYNVDTGDWVRAPDFDGKYDAVQGTLVLVINGTTYGGRLLRLSTTNPITIGTTSLTFTDFFVENANSETFDGDGATLAFTASQSLGSVDNAQVFISGVRQYPTTDYTVNGRTITFLSAPASGTDNILVVYGGPLGIGIPADGTVTGDKIDTSSRFGIGVAASSANLLRIYVDNSLTTGIVRAVHMERYAKADEGVTDGTVYSNLRVYTSITATSPSQAEWAVNSVVESASNNTNNSPVALSGTATKTGDAGVLAGHLNALDTRTYTNRTSVTRLTAVELDVNGLGSDHPTANGNTGSRRGLRIQPRSVQTVAPTWAVWAANTAYSQYDIRVPIGTSLVAGYSGIWLECTTAGTSGGAEPVWNTTVGATNADGTAVWTTRKGFEAGIGLHITTNAGLLGYFRYGALIEEASGDPNKIDVAILIQTTGTTGIQMSTAHSGSDILCSANSGYGITLSGAYTNAAIRLAGTSQSIAFNSSANRKLRVNAATDQFEFLASSTVRALIDMSASPFVQCATFKNDSADVTLATTTSGDVVLSPSGDIKWGKALVALGGGAAPTLGTIGGSGPAAAGQNTWLRLLDSTGAACWVPVWK